METLDSPMGGTAAQRTPGRSPWVSVAGLLPSEPPGGPWCGPSEAFPRCGGALKRSSRIPLAAFAGLQRVFVQAGPGRILDISWFLDMF